MSDDWTIPVHPPLAPMEAQRVDDLPKGPEWRYEPKWDGFRCLAFRDGDRVELQSKAQKPLGRYFPEVVEALRALSPARFVLDGELVVPVEGGAVSFDHLLLRIHPARSRVEHLAKTTPATLVTFDLLVDERGKSLIHLPHSERRALLEGFARGRLTGTDRLALSPQVSDRATAQGWLQSLEGTDGVVAKQADTLYLPGERAMRKVKRLRTADCVVGGFRYAKGGRGVGSLLLGLYDGGGHLHHVGFTSTLRAEQRQALLEELEPLIAPPGFTGRAPGGPSRWSSRRSDEWEPLRPEIVVEVRYDHFSQGRFRHGAKLHRWRPDKAPRQCTLDQVAGKPRRSYALGLLAG